MSADLERLPPPNEPAAFESLCLDLWKDIWGDPGAQKNGRSGQPQAGVDVYGQKDGKWVGVQCKQKNGLLRTKVTIRELDAEVKKAWQFKTPLSVFILATTGPTDTKVQQRARELTEENRANGLFTVEVWSWDKIWHEIYGREELLRRVGPVYWPRQWYLVEQRIRGISPRRESKVGGLHNVPELPPHFLPRTEDLASLKKQVLATARKPVGITGVAAKTGVHGMGGIGKTVLAAALVREPEVRKAFPDGVIWLTFGLTPGITALQRQVGQALGDNPPVLDNDQQGRSYLSGLLAECSALLVFDDVWREEHLVPFNVLGPRCQMLLTTRDARILHHFEATEHRVDKLSEEQASELLSGWAKLNIWESHRLVGFDLVRECGYLPLAIAMIGARVRGEPDELYRQRDRLQARSLHLLERHHPEYQYPHLLRAIEVSVEMLAQDSIPELRDRYLDFAVFPEDTLVPPAVLHTLWRAHDVENDRTRDALDRLVDLALLRREENGWLGLHDLQRDYLQQATKKEITQLHRRLVDAYGTKCKIRNRVAWSHGPNDGYFFQKLAWHMHGAGQSAKLRTLLFDFNWLQAKLEATDIFGVVGDYALSRDDEETLLAQQALSMSAHALATDTKQLAGQILGRLMGFNEPGLKQLVEAAKAWRGAAWLQPSHGNLHPPGTALLRTLHGHSKSVKAVALNADGSRAVSCANGPESNAPGELTVWDVESGKELRKLELHYPHAHALVLSADGRRVVAYAADPKSNGPRDLTLWDVESGRELRKLELHYPYLRVLALSADGRTVAVYADGPEWNAPGELTVWDVESGRELRKLELDYRYHHVLALSADGRMVVAGGNGSKLSNVCGPMEIKAWDVENGTELRTLQVRQAIALKLSADGRWAVNDSYDRVITVWDVESGKEIQTLKICGAEINTFALSGDGLRVMVVFVDGTIEVWALNGKQEWRTIQSNGDTVTAVAMSADGRRAVSGTVNGSVKVWDVEGRRDLRPFKIKGDQGWVTHIALRSGGRQAVSGAEDGSVKVWDVKSGRELRSLYEQPDEVTPVALSADGLWVVFRSAEATLMVWDVERDEEVRMLDKYTCDICAVALSEDGLLVAFGPDKARLKVWEVENDDMVRKLDGDAGDFDALALSADGRTVVAGGSGPKLNTPGKLKVWNVDNGQELRTVKNYGDNIAAVALTADGFRAIYGAYNGTVAVWDVECGDKLQSLGSHSNTICTVAITPEGLRAVSGSLDNTFKVWDVENKRCLATFTGESTISCCAIAAEGRAIVAGERSGRIHFLRLVLPDDPVEKRKSVLR
jgi:WD40 repeat protein